MNLVESLKCSTIVVADNGEIDSIKQYNRRHAVTDSSLLFQTEQKPEYRRLLNAAIQYALRCRAIRPRNARAEWLMVSFGREILRIVPAGLFSTADAAFSFDPEGTRDKAGCLVEMREEARRTRERVLLSIGSTWDGIRPGEEPGRDHVHCDLAVQFGFTQAVACAEAGVMMISPFVGRIYDWHKERSGAEIPTTDVAMSAEEKNRRDEKTLRWMHNEDAVATEKLAEGIGNFTADTPLLEHFARAKVDTLISAASATRRSFAAKASAH